MFLQVCSNIHPHVLQISCTYPPNIPAKSPELGHASLLKQKNLYEQVKKQLEKTKRNFKQHM